MKNQFKKFTVVLAVVASVVVSFNAKAQRAAGIRYSLGVEAGIPVGALSDNYKWNLGGSIQADAPIYKDLLYVTLNAGYNNIFAEKRAAGTAEDIHLIPVKAGIKYFPVANFYVHGEAGVAFITAKHTLANKSAAFVYAPQLGYLIPLGGSSFLDAGVRFEGNTKFYDQGKSSNFLGLRVAYAFGMGK
jgi:hypothetical protein